MNAAWLPGPRVPGHPARVVLAALLAIHAVVQLVGRPYPRWGDAILTFTYSRDFPDVPADHHSTRLGLVLPARLFLELFGFGQVAYYAYPVIMGVVLVAATFAVGRRLFGLRAATVATFLIVFHPTLVRSIGNTTSWQLLPDVPAAAWFTAGLALLLAATGPDGARHVVAKADTVRLVGAGLCFAMSYTCREFVAFMFVLIPLVAVLYRLPWRRLLVVVLPMAALLAVELIVAWAVWGDPLARLRVTGGHGAEVERTPRLETLLKLPRSLYSDPRGTVSLLTLVLTVGGAMLFRRRGLVLAAAWFLSLFVPLLLLGGLADPSYVSLRLQLSRYWVPVLPALVLGAVGTVREAARWAAARGWGRHPSQGRLIAGAVVVFLVWYPIPMVRYAVGPSTDRPWNELRVYLQEHDDRVGRIASDYRSGHELLLYSHEPIGGDLVWHGEITIFRSVQGLAPYKKLARVPRPAELPDSVLLFTEHTARNAPDVADGWLLAFRTEGIRLYVPADGELSALASG